jgi:hypothetical protein
MPHQPYYHYGYPNGFYFGDYYDAYGELPPIYPRRRTCERHRQPLPGPRSEDANLPGQWPARGPGSGRDDWGPQWNYGYGMLWTERAAVEIMNNGGVEGMDIYERDSEGNGQGGGDEQWLLRVVDKMCLIGNV